jgi:hypothetical protein
MWVIVTMPGFKACCLHNLTVQRKAIVFHALPATSSNHDPDASEDIPTTSVCKSDLPNIIEGFVGGVHVCVLGVL